MIKADLVRGIKEFWSTVDVEKYTRYIRSLWTGARTRSPGDQ